MGGDRADRGGLLRRVGGFGRWAAGRLPFPDLGGAFANE